MDNKSAYSLSSRIVTTALGAGLILLGILFLVGRSITSLFHFDVGHYGWPFFIIVPGVLLFMAAFALERKAGLTLAIIGGMTTMVGAILFVQNLFDLFASWAYAWALVGPTSIGLSKVIYGALRGMGDDVRCGLKLTAIGLAIFAIGGLFFELVLGVSGFQFGSSWLFWPGLAIGLGVVLLVSSLLPRSNPPSA